MSAPTKETQILTLLENRSEQAIRELEQAYGTLLYQISHRILNNRQDAEECVNDTYLGVWNNIPPAKPKPLLPYVCKIARNLSLKRYRRERAAKRNSEYEIALEELEDYLPARSPDTVEQTIAAKELARMIEHFLDTLTDENRAIFLRRYWLSEPYAEIAAQVELSEKNVSVRLTRLRTQLKNYLEEQEVFL